MALKKKECLLRTEHRTGFRGTLGGPRGPKTRVTQRILREALPIDAGVNMERPLE